MSCVDGTRFNADSAFVPRRLGDLFIEIMWPTIDKLTLFNISLIIYERLFLCPALVVSVFNLIQIETGPPKV